MARKTNNTEDEKYLAILDADNNIVAFVNPARNVSMEGLLTALTAKKVKAEIREPQVEQTTIKL